MNEKFIVLTTFYVAIKNRSNFLQLPKLYILKVMINQYTLRLWFKDMEHSNSDNMSSNLEKLMKFSMHNFLYQALSRPLSASNIILNRIKFRLMRRSTITSKKLFFGDTMFVKCPDQVGELLYFYSYFEYDLSNVLLSLLKPGMIFVDVGAHFGYFSLLASKLVSSKGFVHSFEPTKKTFDILNMNVSSRPNVKTNQMAVWSSDTYLEFHEYGEILAAYNSFTKPRTQTFHGSVNKTKIQAMRLDTYFKEYDMPDFVKIDAESSELEVLKGMENILKNKAPIISMEVGDLVDDIPSSRSNVEHLLDRNYVAYEIREGKMKPHELKNLYEYGNLIFMKT